ncbi:MAG: NTP transferase domain-containing protein [Nitrosopumilus sp.]|nr:NTP transferase domain-containing protein [Nitrosopumilus sp.]
MIGLVMAGGRGSRMGGAEKLLLPRGDPSVMRVVGALRGAGLRVRAVASGSAPRTRQVLLDAGVDVLDSPGAGYPADLGLALSGIDGPALVVPGDAALMDAAMAREITGLLDRSAWTSVVSTVGFLRGAGLAPGPPAGAGLCYTGISVVGMDARGGSPERLRVVDDKRAAFNINSGWDLALLGAADDLAVDPGL